MGRDFTLNKYREFCLAVIESGYSAVTIAGYLKQLTLPPKLVILRHDVDRSPGNALKMAELEQELGLVATYYFRKQRHTFKPEIISRIAGMGHEIGYHYETMVKAGGHYEKALRIFKDELKEFREICDVVTASMHGSPLSKYDNRDLWRKYDFRDFGIIGEAYLSLDYSRISYLSDTGRTWNGEKYNIRDKVSQDYNPDIKTTDDLISLLKAKQVEQLCILSHPNRWAESGIEYMKTAFYDFMINRAKTIIGLIRPDPQRGAA